MSKHPTPAPTPTRKISRQATSAVAFVADEPESDDPLLAFTPYLHKAPRTNSITPERQRRFIATLAATGIVKQAARRIGKSLEALYRLRAQPGAEGFAAAWDAALTRGVQRLEDCAMERALAGEERPVVSGGKLLGTYRRYDNNLLRFLLQHRLPERYGVQRVKPGHPVYESIKREVRAEIYAAMPTEAEVLDSINAKIAKMRAREEQTAEWRDRERAQGPDRLDGQDSPDAPATPESPEAGSEAGSEAGNTADEETGGQAINNRRGNRPALPRVIRPYSL